VKHVKIALTFFLTEISIQQISRKKPQNIIRFNPEKSQVMHINHAVKTAYTLAFQGQIYPQQEIDKEKDLL